MKNEREERRKYEKRRFLADYMRSTGCERGGLNLPRQILTISGDLNRYSCRTDGASEHSGITVCEANTTSQN